jgi:hypothetical protein
LSLSYLFKFINFLKIIINVCFEKVHYLSYNLSSY